MFIAAEIQSSDIRNVISHIHSKGINIRMLAYNIEI